MRRLFDAADIDYDQWRALTRALLRMDLRSSGGGVQYGANTPTNQSARLTGRIIAYLLMGLFTSIMVFVVDDVMLTATITLTYVMFMVGLAVLVDHQSVITSADDYMVLGSRPVSSRTYFAVRLTNLLVYAWIVTTLYGILPMLSFGVAHGFHPLRGLAAIPAFYLSTTFVTLALVLSYASLVRFLGVGRLTRIMSYAQMIISAAMYLIYLLPGRLVRFGGFNPTMPESPWILLLPPTWFASYLMLAEGSISLRVVLPAAASIVGLLAVARGLSGRLSLDYASRLGAIISATAVAPSSATPRRGPWIFRNGEHRAISMLIRAQFRYDQKFRMAVLGALPLTVMYMFLAFQNGTPADPFNSTPSQMFSWMPLTLTVLFFPMMLRMALTTSDAYRASWIYFGTPVSRAHILRAQTDVLTAAFIVPYIVLIGAIMGYFSGHLAGIFTHILFMGLGSRLLLQTVTVASPVLPFSRPMQKLGRQPRMMALLLVAMVGGFLFGPLLAMFVYVSAVRLVVTLITLIAMSVALDRLTRVRLGERAGQMQFEAGA